MYKLEEHLEKLTICEDEQNGYAKTAPSAAFMCLKKGCMDTDQPLDNLRTVSMAHCCE